MEEVVRENSFLLFFCLSYSLISVKKFYKCVIGIDKYKSDIHYFISGKIYKRVEDMTTLIDELGCYHILPDDIFETHFKPLISHKRRRNDKERR